MTTNATARINTRLSGTLAEHVTQMCSNGAYATPADYVRDLIRRDMDQRQASTLDVNIHRAFEARLVDAYPDLTTDIALAETAEFAPDLLLLESHAA